MEKLCLLLALFTACATESEPRPAQEFLTVTEVEVGPDGAKEISRTQIPAGERPNLPAGEGQVTQALETESPCHLATVFLYDFSGNVLCLGGTGYVHLSQFIHHWKRQTDFFGSPHLIPVGWQRQAGSAWTTFSSAQFYQDESPDPVKTIGPQSGGEFYSYDDEGNIDRFFLPDSVVIY